MKVCENMKNDRKNENKIFGRLHLWECLTTGFLDEIMKKYHYEEKDYTILKKVAADVKICIKEQENFCVAFDGENPVIQQQALVTLTLGSNLDILQERYHKQEKVMESYMLENISSELLRCGYERIHRLIVEKTGMYVEKFCFFGEGEQYSLAQMAEQLKEQEIKNVSCTKDYCLRPSKSVAYRVKLTCEETVSRNICSNCKNRENCSQCSG